MSTFEHSVDSLGGKTLYMLLGIWKMPVQGSKDYARRVSTSLAITDAAVCWESVEEQKRGLFGKTTEAREFQSRSLSDVREASCGALIPEIPRFSLSFGQPFFEIEGPIAANELRDAVNTLRSLGVDVKYDSWMSGNAHSIGL